MPIYEYACDQCGHRFEELVRSERDERSLTCPKCGARKVARQLSVFAARAAAPSAPPPGGCGQCGDAGAACPFKS